MATECEWDEIVGQMGMGTKYGHGNRVGSWERGKEWIVTLFQHTSDVVCLRLTKSAESINFVSSCLSHTSSLIKHSIKFKLNLSLTRRNVVLFTALRFRNFDVAHVISNNSGFMSRVTCTKVLCQSTSGFCFFLHLPTDLDKPDKSVMSFF